jgi:arylsulfatase A-like enzyme
MTTWKQTGKTGALLALLAAGGFAAPAAAEPKPNIVFIMCDDLGYGQLGCYGQKMIKTPNLDRMAQQGLRLTDYYAGTSVCAPSRCALMTGRHVGHSYIRGNMEYPTGQEPIPDEAVTVAEKMKEAGYRTALVGKWGLGYPGSEGDPNRQGFDLFFGYNDQKRAHSYYPGWIWKNNQKVELGARDTSEGYSHYALTREARRFIQDSRDQPFFLYLAYTIPHAHLEIPGDDPCFLQYQNEEWPEKQKIHAGMISRMDEDVGGILDLLRETGLAERTLVVFTSDNGAHREGGAIPEFFNDSGPLRGIKRDMYEGGIRVPFIARWPGTVAPGQVSDHLAAHWDLMPTACELAGVTAPEEIDGISCVPLLKGDVENQQQHDSVYFELHWPDRRGMRAGSWTAVQQAVSGNPDAGDIELYNLETDLAQQNNLAEHYPEKVAEFKKRLAAAHLPSDIFVFGRSKQNSRPAPPPAQEIRPAGRSEESLRVINIDLSRKGQSGPAGHFLPGVAGGEHPVWNTVGSVQPVTGLKDQTGAQTSVGFDLNDDPVLFGAGGPSNTFFHTYAMLTAQGTPGPQRQSGFRLSGLDSSRACNLYCYATWSHITAGSEFRFSSDQGVSWSDWQLVDGVPSQAAAPFSEGHSCAVFKGVAPDANGVLLGQWRTTLQGGSTANRGMFNALQIEEIIPSAE